MRRDYFLAFIAAAALLLPAGTYAGTAHNHDEANGTAAAPAGNTEKDVQERLETKLREYDVLVAALKAKAKKAGEQAKAEIDREVRELEAKRKVADRKLDELKKSTKEAWKDFEKGVSEAMDDLGKSIDKAYSRFK